MNVIFTEVDENAGEIENGIKKDNSLLVKYFKESFRPNLLGKTVNDFVVVQLDDAFDEKELDFIAGDLGLDKNDPASRKKHFLHYLLCPGPSYYHNGSEAWQSRY